MLRTEFEVVRKVMVERLSVSEIGIGGLLATVTNGSSMVGYPSSKGRLTFTKMKGKGR